MADFLPVLPAANPTVIPAKTYDRVWIEEIVIKAQTQMAILLGKSRCISMACLIKQTKMARQYQLLN